MISPSRSARSATADSATPPVPPPPAATGRGAVRPAPPRRSPDPAGPTVPPPPPATAASPAADRGRRRPWCIGPPAHLLAHSATDHQASGQPDRTGGVEGGDTDEPPGADRRATRDQRGSDAGVLRTLLGS